MAAHNGRLQAERANGAIIDRVLLAIVDRFSSKRADPYPTYERGTPLILGKVFAIFGTLETITSDRDKISKSREWQCPMKVLRMNHAQSTANNRQTRWTNGKESPGDTGLFTELPAGLRQKKLSKGIANCSVRIPRCGKPIDWEKRRTS